MGVDLAEKRAMLGARGDEIGAQSLATQIMEGAVDQTGADRIEPFDAAEVEHHLALGFGFFDELRGAVFDGERMVRRPEPDSIACNIPPSRSAVRRGALEERFACARST